MPLRIPTTELQPGMKLRESILASGRVMLQGQRALTSADINVLRRRYPSLTVLIEDPILDCLVDFEDDSHERRIADEAQRRVSQCMSGLYDRFAERASLRDVQFGVLQSTVNELIEYLKANPVSAALVASCLDSSNYLGAHAGNVFFLGMLLGASTLDYVATERRRKIRARGVRHGFATDLAPLGLAAMMCDLGMLPHQNLLKTTRQLTLEESETIRRHPLAGAAMLPESFSSVARVAVKTHHENMCGTGYPARLPGEELHVFARILRIADAFDAATSERVYRGAKSPARVLWEMTAGPFACFYDAELMEAFGGLIQPFPIGSKLRLSDGRYAAVVKYNRRDPFDPVVIIAFDAQDRALPREQLEGPLQIGHRRGLRIASLRGEDLSFIYTMRPSQETHTRERFVTPLQAAYP